MDLIDDLIDYASEGWGYITEAFSYLISFEWFGDIGEFFSAMFEGITEISIFGLLFGLIGFFTVFLARDYMLMPFLKFYDPMGQMFWGGITYVGTFIAGYLLGKYFENTS